MLVAMLLANALFAAIVARMPRRKFIPLAYRFFIVNLSFFFVLMRIAPPGKQPWVDGCFLRLGQRLQSFQHRDLLGIHDGSFHHRTGQAALRIYRRRRIVRGNPRSDHHHFSGSSSQRRLAPVDFAPPCSNWRRNACVFFPPNFGDQMSNRHDDAGNSRKTDRRRAFGTGSPRLPFALPVRALPLYLALHLTSTWTYFQQSELTKRLCRSRARAPPSSPSSISRVNTLTFCFKSFSPAD